MEDQRRKVYLNTGDWIFQTDNVCKNYLDGTVLSSKKLVDGTSKQGKEGGERGRRGNFPLASVGSWAGGNNRKIARRTTGAKGGYFLQV